MLNCNKSASNLVLLLILTSCMLSLSSVADAAISPELWCGDVEYDSSHPLAFETIKEKTDYSALISSGKWRQADAIIITEFMRFIEGINNNTTLDSYKKALDNYINDNERITSKWRPFKMNGNLIYDIQALEDDNIVKCNAFKTDKSTQAIIYTSAALFRSGQIEFKPALQVTSQAVKIVYETHKNRLYNGLPMWPWETYVNGLHMNLESTKPTIASKNQIVFMRPSISPLLKFDGNENSELDLGMIVEPVGIVRYLNDDYSSWLGVSPMMAITNGNGIGYGLLVRYNKWQVAAGYHEKDNEDDDILLYVSMDLYDFVTDKDKRKAIKDNILEDLKKKLIYTESSQ